MTSTTALAVAPRPLPLALPGVRPGWVEVAARFLASRTGATRDAYRRDLGDLTLWAQGRGLDPLDLDRALADLWRDDLAARYAPATVARRLAAAAGAFTYAVEEGYLDRSPFASTRRPRVPSTSPREGLTREEAAAFLAVADADPRDAVVAGLLLLLGLRASEVGALDLDDLDRDRGHRVATVTGKGGRRDRVPLAPYLSDALDRYLAVRGDASGPLLTNANGDRLDRHAVARVVTRLARAAGITRRVCPHDLRHAFVTNALAAGVPLHAVQDAARHADPATTRRYDRARYALDGHATYALAAYLGAAA